ncbi:MAG: cadherin-like domain-containing protein [Acidobacteria bacterium]|nr:cadherin-like domain-containing protein [Acidobacteriota bacterium]
MSPILSRTRLLLVFAGMIAALLIGLGAPGPRPVAPLTATHQARINRELAKSAERGFEQRFDQPDEAQAFYANRRTGPLLTRGPNPTTGIRPLSPAAYLPAVQQMRGMSRFSSATGTPLPSFDADPAAEQIALGTWSPLGPSNQGGRTRALLIDPGNASIMYAGGVAGGVWKSIDAGASWTPLSDLMANIAVVSLAFDPANANTIYAGTGEGVFNGDAIRGAGIFRSTNAGTTWSQLPSTNTSDFHYVNSLVVSPRNSMRMFAATRTGIFRSINGGSSWSSLVSATAVNGCTQIAMQNTGAGFVFASCGNFAQGTVYRALDDDVSTLSSVLSLSAMGRSSIAIAPSNPAVVYVMAARTGTAGLGAHSLHGIYRSAANGDSGSFTTQVDGAAVPATLQQKLNRLQLTNPVIALLTECGFGTSSFSNQGWYDNVIAVDPMDANVVWAGGIDLFRSDDGGLNWGAAGYWWFDKGIDPQYHHADQHGIVFHPSYNGTSNKVMFSASDGGVERIDDARAPVNTTLAQICGSPVAGSPTWVDRNSGYTTTQFYDGAVYPDGQTYFGGLQDNGTQRGTSASTNWTTLAGGDGGYAAVDTLGDVNAANDVLFLENTGNSLKKSTNGGATFTDANAGITGSGFLFIAPFAMNDGTRQQLWTGGYDIWRTTNQAVAWSRATGVNGTCGAGSISAIATHPLDGNRVLIGMSDGCYHYNHAALSAPNTGNWLGGGFIGTGTRQGLGLISSMAWDPQNLNIAYTAISAFGVTNLLKSIDGGVTWAPSVGTGPSALPQIPVLSVVVNPDVPQKVYVGTDLGVFTSIDGGASWLVENTGFANVPVEALKMSEAAPRRLYAFTHGRGAWRVALAGTVVPPSAVNDSYSTPFNTPLVQAAPGVLGNDNANGGGAMTAVLDTTVGAGAGVLALNTNGGFTFTPAASFSGPASFTYHASNSNGSSNIATVALTVGAPGGPPPPTSATDNYFATEGTVLNVAAPGVLGNDNSNGGGTMTASLDVTLPSHGGVTLSPDGSFAYTPTAGFVGNDAFTYRASTVAGGFGLPATVNIAVASSTTPLPPSNFRILAMSGNNVTFAWRLPTTGPTPTSIQLEGGLTPGSVLGAIPLGVTPAATINLPTGSFYIRLRTNASGVLSGPSNELLVHVNVPVPPSAPANLLGLVNGSAVALAWTPTFGGGAPTGAILDVSGALSLSMPLGPGDTFTFPSVPPGAYTFRLRQTGAGGASGPSNPVTLTFPGACSGPPQSASNFLAFKSGGNLYLYWEPPVSGTAASGYQLNVTGSFVGTFPMSGRSFSIAAPPGTFTLSITAANACGTGAPTSSQTVTFP